MDIEFYDVKNRKKVSVASSQVKKTKYTRTTKAGKTQTRYAVKSEVGGVKLTKFVSQDMWEKLSVPEV